MATMIIWLPSAMRPPNGSAQFWAVGERLSTKLCRRVGVKFSARKSFSIMPPPSEPVIVPVSVSALPPGEVSPSAVAT